ncbi:hypothetical protein [Rhizobium sp. SRDI969]|uniref:hypothetical protein n=1 Tax=Rhizobium sp. SRDI969 TaxID=3138252 RepID=UPI0021A35D41|nr:hypothetical protein [Rhizobium leguminosarum]UWM84741.1 hypothetical protein N2A41_28385 [Rhizobium leguminosarum bv. viciae]
MYSYDKLAARRIVLLSILGNCGYSMAFDEESILAVATLESSESRAMASPLGWIHYTLFLLPVLLHHWQRPWAWLTAAALVIPVPVILGYFGAPRLAQLGPGSVYAWALLLLLIGLIAAERKRQSAAHAFLR